MSTLPQVDNSFYDNLGSRWYNDDSHAIALLKVESKQKLKYVEEILQKHGVSRDSLILDIGCGAGFISNPLATQGYRVKGVDLSAGSLEIARTHAPEGARISYEVQNAYELKEAAESVDVVLLLDVLEHVEDAKLAIEQASRVLRPGGLLIFHTFNRTWMSKFLAIKGISFVTRDCPDHVHVYHLFLKPEELVGLGKAQGLSAGDLRGIRPQVFHYPFFWSVLNRRVHPKFSFTFTKSLAVGYLGYLTKPNQ